MWAKKDGESLGKPQGSVQPRLSTIMLLAFLWNHYVMNGCDHKGIGTKLWASLSGPHWLYHYFYILLYHSIQISHVFSMVTIVCVQMFT